MLSYLPIPLIPLPFHSNGRGTRGFVPTKVSDDMVLILIRVLYFVGTYK
jgi:hypothetical protein